MKFQDNFDLTQFLKSNFQLPTDLESLRGREARKVADSILRLSDFYIEDQKNTTPSTPWKENWAIEAYSAYFLPLNLQRARRVVEKGLEVGFFEGLEKFVDFGCGPATVSSVLKDLHAWKEFYLTDISAAPVEKLAPKFLPNFSTTWKPALIKGSTSLAVFSYVINELGTIPSWALECEAIMIIEPSTSVQARRLMEMRKLLLANGFHLWAPCTHHQECPLLKNSKTDWCHDAVMTERPQWFLEIENYLPMKNERITFSYLLARKTPPKTRARGRIVGDLLKEKGKRRQMYCESEDRIFLSWLDRHYSPKAPVGYERGDLIAELPPHEKVSNEYRILEPVNKLSDS
ncbi:MAG: small ribosomal subunit Rsm22 family protein [Bdellovibrionota bacterium]